uniref:Uncharacterized protein n=1 Tax=Myotis myotis TaxID=51298 RepID=A0A7J7Z5F7_MYOMY|nr:hypothetical protein mMyoMyo1_010554 [Myotis myotis]
MHEIHARVGLLSPGCQHHFPLAPMTWASLTAPASSGRSSGRMSGLISILHFYYYRYHNGQFEFVFLLNHGFFIITERLMKSTSNFSYINYYIILSPFCLNIIKDKAYQYVNLLPQSNYTTTAV